MHRKEPKKKSRDYPLRKIIVKQQQWTRWMGCRLASSRPSTTSFPTPLLPRGRRQRDECRCVRLKVPSRSGQVRLPGTPIDLEIEGHRHPDLREIIECLGMRESQRVPLFHAPPFTRAFSRAIFFSDTRHAIMPNASGEIRRVAEGSSFSRATFYTPFFTRHLFHTHARLATHVTP